MLTAISHVTWCLGANVLRSSKPRNHTKSDFNPPQTSKERLFQWRPGRKILALACHWKRQSSRSRSILLKSEYRREMTWIYKVLL